MKLLLTGAAGYTGTGIAQVLATRHDVRGLDIKPNHTLPDHQVADLADLDACRRAVQGVDAVVMCHMAPNPTAYQTPPLAYDVNIKGTANLYHAMLEAGVLRAVLISSTGVLFHQKPKANAVPGEGPYNFANGRYALTKIMQEIIARHHFDQDGVVTTLLRPGWIVYDGTLTTKYGQKLESYSPGLIDPRDIGAAVLKALDLADPGLEAFTIAQDDDPGDLEPTRQRLGWQATHTFEALRAGQA